MLFRAVFTYITLFLSNICMLVIYLFYATQQTYICYCSPWHMLFKKSHNMHMLFSLVCSTSGPMSSFRHGIQVYSVIMWSYKFYGWVSWSCLNCVITERLESQSTLNPRSHDNLVNRCGWWSSSHSSSLSETRHVSGRSLLKKISY